MRRLKVKNIREAIKGLPDDAPVFPDWAEVPGDDAPHARPVAHDSTHHARRRRSPAPTTGDRARAAARPLAGTTFDTDRCMNERRRPHRRGRGPRPFGRQPADAQGEPNPYRDASEQQQQQPPVAPGAGGEGGIVGGGSSGGGGSSTATEPRGGGGGGIDAPATPDVGVM